MNTDKAKAPSTKFKAIELGASLCVAWQLTNKRVILVGGGQVAAGRLRYLLESGAKVTVICPSEGMCEEVRWRIEEEGLVSEWKNRKFGEVAVGVEEENLEGVEMVLTAIDDVGLSSKICKMCRDKRIIVNVADVPEECDFYFGSMIRQGPLQIMFSTSGQAPRLASRIRQHLQQFLPPRSGQAITQVGILRKMLRELTTTTTTTTATTTTAAPAAVSSSRSARDVDGAGDAFMSQLRMKFMKDVCDSCSLDELASMTEEDMNVLLQSWRQECLKRRDGCTSQEMNTTNPPRPSWHHKGVPFRLEWTPCLSCDVFDAKAGWALPASMGFALGLATCFTLMIHGKKG